MKSFAGQKLAQEWAKYRWGVMEEHGYPDDPLFPLAYEKQVESGEELSQNGPSWIPNICTNLQELESNFVNTEECPNCELVVEDTSANYSLMSLRDENYPVSITFLFH